MYNFSNFIHTVRFAARDHNQECIAKVEKHLTLKSVANNPLQWGVEAMLVEASE
jgi:hypothetical protein